MSKFFRVDGGDYKITVQNGGQIILDTGSEEGTVVITGDLRVEGVTTTVVFNTISESGYIKVVFNPANLGTSGQVNFKCRKK